MNLIELKRTEKLIDMNLEVYDNAMKNNDYKTAAEHLDLIDKLIESMDSDTVKLTTEKVVQ